MKRSLFDKNRKGMIELNTNLQNLKITESIRNYKFNKIEMTNEEKKVNLNKSFHTPKPKYKPNKSVAITEIYNNKLNHSEIETTNNQYMQTFQMEINPFDDNEISLILMQFLRTYYPLFHQNYAFRI
jgi:hypothetical protein